MIKINSNILFRRFYNFSNTRGTIFFGIKFVAIPFILLFFSFGFFPSVTRAQGLVFSYSYENVTRNNGGGNLESGDTIEVHALAKVNTATKDFYYTDTISTGTQFVSGSLQIVTNEGLNFRGPYTDASGDDLGEYDISNGIPRIRVNLGTGATNPSSGTVNFGVTTGGGTINPGDKPKFYGTTLFMVSYRLVVTAGFGDTIHLTGNYYFDTSGVNTTYRFDYAGIKIIRNSGLCTNFLGASFTADSSFKTGNTQNRALPAIVPGYIKINLGPNSPNDGYYAIANNTSADGTTDNTGPYKPGVNNHRVFGGAWDIIGDHTGAINPALGNAAVSPGTNGGYMLVVNASYPAGEAFRDTIKNICPNTYYEFSAWVRNICGVCGSDSNSVLTYTPGVLPNLTFAVNDIDYYTSGNIVHDNNWVKRGFLYQTGTSDTQFTISIKNNAAGGGGNDWVLDDIKLATCYPNLIMNPNDTVSACAGYPVTITDTVKSFFNNYGYFMWEVSLNNGVTWVSLPTTKGFKAPVLENGLWVYHVDTVFIPTAADSGYLIRLKVASTSSNLTNSNCSVNNSQYVFLKIYSSSCSVLDAMLLNFSGAIVNNKASLQWTSKNEDGLKEYDVEKSLNGINFSPIGEVAAVNSPGATYVFNDPEDISNIAYYRLKIMNSDLNNTKYSKVIALFNKRASFRVRTVNPFSNNLRIEVFLPKEGDIEFNLCDIYGNVVSSKSFSLGMGDSQITFDNLNGLTPGVYILRAFYNGTLLLNKLIKTSN